MRTISQTAAERAPAAAPDVEFERSPRCRIGLRHYRRPRAPFAPSPLAVAGALDIFLEGRFRDDVLRMLFGLSILQSATAEQADAALAARDVALDTDVPGSLATRVAPAVILL